MTVPLGAVATCHSPGRELTTLWFQNLEGTSLGVLRGRAEFLQDQILAVPAH